MVLLDEPQEMPMIFHRLRGVSAADSIPKPFQEEL